MKHGEDVHMLQHSLKRNRVKIIVMIMAIVAGVAIGSYAGVQAYYHGWLG